MLEPLLIAQLDAREVEHAVLHGAEHLLAAAGARTLEQRGDDAQRQMQAGARIADLRAGDERRAVTETGGRGRAAGALRDVLVDLAVLVRAGAKALHRRDDHTRVGLVDVIPGQPHAVERAGGEVLNQHVAALDQLVEHALALRVLRIDRDRALVVVEHGEVERVRVRHVAQLAARDVANAGALDLDHVGAEPGKQLRAGRARLHMREVEDAHALQRLAVHAERLRRGLRQTVAADFRHRPGDGLLGALHRLGDDGPARGLFRCGFALRGFLGSFLGSLLRFLGHMILHNFGSCPGRSAARSEAEWCAAEPGPG